MLPDWSENRDRFNREIPAFVHYLINVFKIQEVNRHQRFGVIAYHNPDVIEMLQQFEPHLRLLEILDATFFKNDDAILVRESAAEIHQQLCAGSHGVIARQLLSSIHICGLLLGKLAKAQPERFSKSTVKGTARWEIKAPKK